MSTDLTTTIILNDVRPKRGVNGSTAAVRFIHNQVGGLAMRCNPAESDGHVTVSEEDAIMLRDWLNDEWPVAAPAEPEEYLWGVEGDGYPQRGCPCPGCGKARGR